MAEVIISRKGRIVTLKREERTCLHCGKTFVLPKAWLKRGKGTGTYCSKTCMNLDKAKDGLTAQQRFRLKNRDRLRERSRAYYQENKEQERERGKAWAEANREWYRNYEREYRKKSSRARARQ